MILLSVAVCLVTSGPCLNYKADQTFPTFEACESRGNQQLARLMRILDPEKYQPGAVSCTVVPEDEDG